MAWTAATQWNFAPDGAALGGGAGGFDASFGGVDYSQQIAPILSVSDAVGTSTTTITSATGGFTSPMKGNGIVVNGNLYQITAVASTNSITVDRTTGTFTGQGAKVGGAFACKGPSTSCFEPIYYGVHVAGQKYWFKNQTAGGVLTTYAPAANMVFSAGAQYNLSEYEGYGAVRGDGGVADFGATWAGFANGTAFIHCRYLKIRGVQSASVLNCGGAGQIWEDCLFDASAFTNNYCLQVGTSTTTLFRRCELIGCASGSAATLRENAGATYEECRIEGRGQVNVSIEGGNTPIFQFCIVNGGTYGFQVNNNSAGVRARWSIIWGASVSGIDFPAGDLHDGESTIVQDCILGKNTSYDISHTVSDVTGNAGARAWVNACFRCNWFYTTGTGRYRNMPAASDDSVLTANPFMNDAIGDFRLNSVSGGGALIRAAACSHLWPDGINSTSLYAGPYGTPAASDTTTAMISLWRELAAEPWSTIDDTVPTGYIDSGMEALNRRIRFHWTTDSTSTTLLAGVMEYSVPTDCSEIRWIRWNGKELPKGSVDEWRSRGDDWQALDPGLPQEWAMYGNKLVFRPAPSAAAVAISANPTLRYCSKPPSIATVGGDQLNSQDWRVPVYWGVAEYSSSWPDSQTAQMRAAHYSAKFDTEAALIAVDYKDRALDK